jgi:hypothetical protein
LHGEGRGVGGGVESVDFPKAGDPCSRPAEGRRGPYFAQGHELRQEEPWTPNGAHSASGTPQFPFVSGLARRAREADEEARSFGVTTTSPPLKVQAWHSAPE